MAWFLLGGAVVLTAALVLRRLLAVLPPGPDDERQPVPAGWAGGWADDPGALAETLSRLRARGVPVRAVSPTAAFATFIVRFADGTDLLVRVPRAQVGTFRVAARLHPIAATVGPAGALTLTWPGGGTPVSLLAATAPVTVRG